MSQIPTNIRKRETSQFFFEIFYFLYYENNKIYTRKCNKNNFCVDYLKNESNPFLVT